MREEYCILEGKSLDGLVEEGLKKLGVNKDQVNVEVLESKKTLFSSYFKIKVSLKASKTLDVIEKSLQDICETALDDKFLSKKKDLEFIYNEEGVFIKFDKAMTFDDIKFKAELKKITNVNYQELISALQSEKFNQLVKIAETQEEAKIDSSCIVRMTDDQLEAFLYITSPVGGKDITEGEIYKALKENQVVFGIKEDEIRNIVNNKLYDMEMKIAEGMMPVNGEDAQLEYHFDTSNETKLMETTDGKIDFRELSLIKNVKAGQVLVTMTPATDGIAGRSVLNEGVNPKPGKKLVLPKGKNVNISEDGLQLLSAIDGEVKVLDGKVHVFALFIVPANVDNSTGNIRFIGKVVVKGNVLTGFAIEADGDVEVYGVVEGAKIISKGSIILHRGIQGMNKGELYCDGDLVAKFIENSIVEVKGNLHSDAIMHSHVVCGKKLEAAGRKGLLVGGNFKVSDEIKAKVIGSPMATITELEVGANPEMRKKYDAVKAELKSLLENREKVGQAVDLLTKISQKSELPPEKRELLAKSIQAKLQLTQKIDAINMELKEMENYLEELTKGKIKASDVINPGTRVVIGSSLMYVRDPLQHLTLYRANAEIKIGPYEN